MSAGADVAGSSGRSAPSPARRVVVGGTFVVAVVTAAVTWSQVVAHLHAPDPIEAHGTPAAIVWADRVFRSEAEFAAYMRRRGVRYDRWVRTHPAAVSILRSRERAAAVRPSTSRVAPAARDDDAATLETSLVVASIGGALVLFAAATVAVSSGRLPERRRPVARSVTISQAPPPVDSAPEPPAPPAPPVSAESHAQSEALVVEEAPPSPVEREAPAAAAARTCELRWWRGYVKSRFYAVAIEADGSRATIAQSPDFSWRHGSPPTEIPEAVAALEAVVEAVRRAGWTAAGRGDAWYELRFEARAD